MLYGVTAIATIAYFVATGFFFSALRESSERSVVGGRITMWLAVIATAFTTGILIQQSGAAALVDTRTVFVALVVLMGIGYLVASRANESLAMLGGFVAPTSGLLLCAFLLLQSVSVGIANQVTAILVAHIAFATLGIGAFILASCVASLYLLQERMLRSRSFNRVFQHIPGLEELEHLSLRMIVTGFVLFSLALALGVIWAVHIGESGQMVRIYLSGAAWALFAVMLYVRVRSGWRGTQAAWLTIVGTLTALAVLGVYVLA